jgi:hypothetical protein
MSVTFGKVTRAFFGKTSLTKTIFNGVFVVKSSLDIAEVWQMAAETCDGYPPKHRRLGGEFRAVIRRERSGREFIAYGSSIKSKSGENIVLIPDWKLACGESRGCMFFKIASARLLSGSIKEVEEMESWINEFERNLQNRDPGSAVTLES